MLGDNAIMIFLNKLESLLKERKEMLPEGAYSAKLFQEGVDRIAKKVTEEAGEVIIAAKNNDPEELKNESADLLFHLMVLLINQGLSLNDVISVLERRHK